MRAGLCVLQGQTHWEDASPAPRALSQGPAGRRREERRGEERRGEERREEKRREEKRREEKRREEKRREERRGEERRGEERREEKRGKEKRGKEKRRAQSTEIWGKPPPSTLCWPSSGRWARQHLLLGVCALLPIALSWKMELLETEKCLRSFPCKHAVYSSYTAVL